jgi:hypothetical protein
VPSAKENTISEVQFSAFYPRQLAHKERGSVIAYIHLADIFDLILRDVMKFEDEFGGEIPPPRTAKQQATLRSGTPVTIVPECQELEFYPPTLTKLWEKDWARYSFDFKGNEKLIGETVIVHLSIQVAGIEIASIKNCAIEFTGAVTRFAHTIPKEPAPQPQSTAFVLENRLAKAKMAFLARMGTSTASTYQRIFVSYSRKDLDVVQVYRAAQDAVGNDVFIDTEKIHTGDDWEAQLALEIDRADVFQLFWSKNSAISKFVHDEWDYALKYKCPEDKCVRFIRPVYWRGDNPDPSPPSELAHLHFRRVNLDLDNSKRSDH